MRFGDFAGNAAAKRQLAAQVDAGRFPHALLIEGEPGTGRRTLAGILARAAVCRAEDPAARPCGVCAACRKSDPPDVFRYGGEGAALNVDAVRQMREQAFILPHESPCQVMILEEAQAMLPPAQNALLKVLEEPPAHTRFILTCENRAQLLSTVLSRCVCVTLGPVEWEEAAPVLRARLPRATEEELRRAHGLFGGRIGQVIAGLEDGTFRRVTELVPRFALAVIAPQEAGLITLTGELENDRDLTAGVLEGLRLVFRDALVRQNGGNTALSTAPEAAEKAAAALSGARLMALVGAIGDAEAALRHNMNKTLWLTRLCASLRQAAGK